MKKIIEIHLLDEDQITQKYNNERISQELIEYLIKEAKTVNKNDEIELLIHNECNTELSYMNMIKQGIEREYEHMVLEHNRINMIQLGLLLIGILFIFLSTIIDTNVIGKEILLITGSVPIWEMIDIELFNESKGRRKKYILKKLMESTITDNTDISNLPE